MSRVLWLVASLCHMFTCLLVLWHLHGITVTRLLLRAETSTYTISQIVQKYKWKEMKDCWLGNKWGGHSTGWKECWSVSSNTGTNLATECQKWMCWACNAVIIMSQFSIHLINCFLWSWHVRHTHWPHCTKEKRHREHTHWHIRVVQEEKDKGYLL